MNLFIKICGITTLKDAEFVSKLGADAIGLIMYKDSPRFINLEMANKIIQVLPEKVLPVMVFVDSENNYVQDCLDLSPRIIPQFHGNESQEFCNSFGRNYIKALRVGDGKDLKESFEIYDDSWMLLVDTFRSDRVGGTGMSFNWKSFKHNLNKPFLLAGGLTPDNIERALSLISCRGLDVSSGVESSPGKKDKIKVEKFIKKVRNFYDGK